MPKFVLALIASLYYIGVFGQTTLSSGSVGYYNQVSANERSTIDESKSVSYQDFTLYYRFDRTDIDSTYLDNAEQIERIIAYLDGTESVDSITIKAWASPEGAFRHNVWLAEERALTAKNFLLQNSPDSAKLDSGKIHIEPLAENWPGLLEEVEARYHRNDRERVLRILRTEGIGDETRKWRLRQLDGGYTWDFLVRNYMPRLRAATWISVYKHPAEPIAVAGEVGAPIAVEGELVHIEPMPIPPKEERTLFAVKSNLLYDAATMVNYSVEVPFGERFSALFQQYTPWWLSKNNKYCLQFLTLGGEFRYWFAPQPRPADDKRGKRDALVGHFVGLHAWSGKADFQWGRDIGCYQFEFASVGLTYGYSMPISKAFNLEFSLSVGYARAPYQHYLPTDDWQILIKDDNKKGTFHYFGPTKAEVSLVFPITNYFGKKGGRR